MEKVLLQSRATHFKTKKFEAGFYEYVEKKRLKQERKIKRIVKQAKGFLADKDSSKEQIAWAKDVLAKVEEQD